MLRFNFSPFPELQTQRLHLKRITAEDAPAFFEMRSNPDVMKYIGRPLAKTVQDALALIEVISNALDKNDGITWGIFPKGNPTLRGTIGFWQVLKEHHRAEIGYLLHPALQGKGLMQEALTSVLNFGFETMKLHTVEANVTPGNKASENLLLRNGFIQEGYLKESYYFNGRFLDTMIFSLQAPK